MQEHILVGLSSAPSNARIIRTAATMAKAFGGSFTALFVRTPNFDQGFKTVALFDTVETKVGRSLGDIPVLHMDTLEDFIRENVVDIAVLALPKRNAQDALERLYNVGVRAIWNFAPTDLTHPEDMLVVNVHLSDSLQQLSYRMAHRNDP